MRLVNAYLRLVRSVESEHYFMNFLFLFFNTEKIKLLKTDFAVLY